MKLGKKKEMLLKSSSSISRMSRSCDQEQFNVIFFGGFYRKLNRSVENANQVDISSFTTLKSLSPTQKNLGITRQHVRRKKPPLGGRQVLACH